MFGLEITEINIQILNNPVGGPLLGFARICLNRAFVVNGIRICNGKFGRFVAFPREINKIKNKAFTICHPVKKELQDEICLRVLEEYEAVVRAAA